MIPEQGTESVDRRSLTRRQEVILVLVGVGALAIRLLYLWGQARNNPLFEHPKVDALVHHEWAQRIASGEGMDSTPYFRAPLYYYLLGFLYKLVGPSVAWGRAAGCVVGALTCYLVGRVGAALAGFGAGLLAGLLAAVYWPAIYFDAELLTVGLECCLEVGLLLALLWAARKGTLPRFILAGVVWGLLAITRPNFLALAPGILVWLWLAALPRQRVRRKLAAGALICAGASAVVLPVTLRNYLVSGEAVLISYSGGVNFYIGNNPESDGASAVAPAIRRSRQGGYDDTHRIPALALGRTPSAREVSNYWYGRAFEWIRSEPGAWAAHLLAKFRWFWSPVEIPNNQPIRFFAWRSGLGWLFWIGFPVVACAGVAGLVLLLPRWRTWLLPLVFLVIYLATVVAFFCNARYRLPVFPLLVLFSAAGLVRVVESARSWRAGPIVAYAVALVAMAAVLATGPPGHFRVFHSRNAGEGFKMLGDYWATPPPDGPGDYEQAVQHYRNAVHRKPDSPNLRLALARAWQRIDRMDKAEEHFAKGVDLHPDNAEVRLGYAQFLATQGRTAEAVEQYKATIELQPSYAEAHEGLGCVLASLGREVEAVRHLRRALALQPGLIEGRLCLASVLAANGHGDEAAILCQQVLELDPGNPRALDRLREIRGGTDGSSRGGGMAP